jgi:hypothetical protein
VVCACDNIVRCGPKGTNAPRPPSRGGMNAGNIAASLVFVSMAAGAVAVYRTPAYRTKVTQWIGGQPATVIGVSSQGELGEQLTA